jgi:hypothetical protein
MNKREGLDLLGAEIRDLVRALGAKGASAVVSFSNSPRRDDDEVDRFLAGLENRLSRTFGQNPDCSAWSAMVSIREILAIFDTLGAAGVESLIGFARGERATSELAPLIDHLGSRLKVQCLSISPNRIERLGPMVAWPAGKGKLPAPMGGKTEVEWAAGSGRIIISSLPTGALVQRPPLTEVERLHPNLCTFGVSPELAEWIIERVRFSAEPAQAIPQGSGAGVKYPWVTVIPGSEDSAEEPALEARLCACGRILGEQVHLALRGSALVRDPEESASAAEEPTLCEITSQSAAAG